MSSVNKVLYYLKQFLGLTSIMFSITVLSYTLFYKAFGDEVIAITGIFEALGLATIFALLQIGLYCLSNYYTFLATKAFIFIQYFILLLTIIPWSIYFNWGDWQSPIYVIIFVGVFTITYFIVYFFFNLKLKKEEELLNKYLKKCQDNLH